MVLFKLSMQNKMIKSKALSDPHHAVEKKGSIYRAVFRASMAVEDYLGSQSWVNSRIREFINYNHHSNKGQRVIGYAAR